MIPEELHPPLHRRHGCTACWVTWETSEQGSTCWACDAEGIRATGPGTKFSAPAGRPIEYRRPGDSGGVETFAPPCVEALHRATWDTDGADVETLVREALR